MSLSRLASCLRSQSCRALFLITGVTLFDFSDESDQLWYWECKTGENEETGEPTVAKFYLEQDKEVRYCFYFDLIAVLLCLDFGLLTSSIRVLNRESPRMCVFLK